MIQHLDRSPHDCNRVPPSLPRGIVLEDAHGIIQACNLDAQLILGLKREQLVGKESSFLWYGAIDPDGSPVTLTGGDRKIIGIPREKDGLLWLEVDVQFLFGVDRDHPVNVSYSFRTLDSMGENLLEDLQTEIERQKTEVTSCESETKFKTIFESEMIPMGIWTKAGAILEANKALLNLLGYSKEELARGEIDWVAMTPPEYKEQDRKVLEEIAAKGYSTPFEKVYLHKDGHPIPILVGAASFTDDRDSGVFFVIDLTSRQQAQEALKLSEAKFSRLVDANIFGVAIGDRAGRMLYANDALLNMIGYDREELDVSGIYWMDLTPPEFLPLDRAAGEELLEKGVCTPFEKEYIHKCGHRVPILIGSALLDPTGEGTEQVITFYMDLTKLKRAESFYRETAESLSLSLQAAHMGYWQWDKSTDRVTFSGGGSEIFEVVEGQTITWAEIQTRIHHEDIHFTREAVGRALELGEDYDIEYRLRLSNGEERWVSAKGRAKHDLAGEVVGMVGVAQDITERKLSTAQLQQQARELNQLNTSLQETTNLLRQRNQELDKFAYVVSHDLKAPLRAIANLSVWLEDDLREKLSPDDEQLMNLLRARVYRLEALIDGLLAYSRVGRLEVPTEMTDVESLLEEIIDSLMPLPGFEIFIHPPLPSFATKKLLLSQVFSNLIGNAIKHHDRERGEIHISVNEGRFFCQFAVSDDGPGIAAEYHEKIFTIFQTLESRDKKENTGIGLSIVKKIVETEGGRIWLDSEPGKGTTFYFTWPKYPRVEKNTNSEEISVSVSENS